MSENDSSQQVNWGSFFRSIVWFLALGLFLGIGFENSLIFFSILIIGMFVAFFFAVNPSGDNSKGKTVKVEESVSEEEDQNVNDGSKTSAELDENDLIGEVINCYSFAVKDGGVARLKVDEPIVVGDLIKFSSSKAHFTQEIEEIRAGGANTKELAREGKVSIRVDRLVEVGARVFLVSKDNRPADVKDRTLEKQKKEEDSNTTEKIEEKDKAVTEEIKHSEEESGEIRDSALDYKEKFEAKPEEFSNSKEALKKDKPKEQIVDGVVKNYWYLVSRKKYLAKVELQKKLIVGYKIKFFGENTSFSQEVDRVKVGDGWTKSAPPDETVEIVTENKIQKGDKFTIVKREKPGGNEEDEAKKDPEVEVQKLGKTTNYWNLATDEGGLAKVKVCKEIKKGDVVRFYGENTDFSQTIELIKQHGKEKLATSEGEKADIKVKKRVRVGDEILSTSSAGRNSHHETQETGAKKEDREAREEDDESPEERKKRINSLLGYKEDAGRLEKEDSLEKETEPQFRPIAPSKQDEGVSLNDKERSENVKTSENEEEEKENRSEKPDSKTESENVTRTFKGQKEDKERKRVIKIGKVVGLLIKIKSLLEEKRNSELEEEVEGPPDNPFLARRPVTDSHLECLRKSLLEKLLPPEVSVEEKPDSDGEESDVENGLRENKKDLRLSTRVSSKYFTKSINNLRSQVLRSLIDVDSLDSKEEKRRKTKEARNRERIDFSNGCAGSNEGNVFWSRWSNRVERLEPNSFKDEAACPDDVEKDLTGQNDGENSTVQNYFNSFSSEIYSKQEENEVAQRVVQGDEDARRKFIEHNLRLPINIAKRYRWTNVQFEDLIQAGNEGLIQAVDRFDPEQGNKFSTYATYWIRQRISRFAQRSRLVRIPAHIQALQRKINNLAQSNTREVELNKDELASELDTSVENINRALKHEEEIRSLNREVQIRYPDEIGSKLNRGRLNEVNSLQRSGPVNFYSKFKDFGTEVKRKYGLEAAVKDLNSMSHDINMWKIKKYELKRLLKTELTDREYRIILLRYGFNGDEKTLEEAGQVFDISRERVRQLQNRAIENLQDLKLMSKFRAYKAYHDQKKSIKRCELEKPWPTGGGKNSEKA